MKWHNIFVVSIRSSMMLIIPIDKCLPNKGPLKITTKLDEIIYLHTSQQHQLMPWLISCAQNQWFWLPEGSKFAKVFLTKILICQSFTCQNFALYDTFANPKIYFANWNLLLSRICFLISNYLCSVKSREKSCWLV